MVNTVFFFLFFSFFQFFLVEVFCKTTRIFYVSRVVIQRSWEKFLVSYFLFSSLWVSFPTAAAEVQQVTLFFHVAESCPLAEEFDGRFLMVFFRLLIIVFWILMVFLGF